MVRTGRIAATVALGSAVFLNLLGETGIRRYPAGAGFTRRRQGGARAVQRAHGCTYRSEGGARLAAQCVRCQRTARPGGGVVSASARPDRRLDPLRELADRDATAAGDSGVGAPAPRPAQSASRIVTRERRVLQPQNTPDLSRRSVRYGGLPGHRISGNGQPAPQVQQARAGSLHPPLCTAHSDAGHCPAPR